MNHRSTILLIGIIPIILFSLFTPALAATVVINEVAWMGTGAVANDEWIELLNTTSSSISLVGWTIVAKDGNPSIGPLPAGASIPAYGFYLLEITDDSTISDIPADFIYPTAGNLMQDNGETLDLKDNLNITIDTANIVGYPPGDAWPAGDSSPSSRASMERIDPLASDTDANWITNRGLSGGSDRKGNPVTGTPGNNNSTFAPYYATPGPFLCLDFDGINDHVEFSDDPVFEFGSEGTLEAWVYMFATLDRAGIIHKGNGFGAGNEAYSLRFGFGTQNDQVQLVVRDAAGADTITGNTSLTPKIWYHVAGVWDGNTDGDASDQTMALYINGIQDTSGSCTRTARDASDKLFLGALYDFGTNPLSGRIDEVRMWSDVRTATEIRANMCKKLAGTEPNLTSNWRFDELSGTFCYDFATTAVSNIGYMHNMYWPDDRICSSASLGDNSAYDYTGSSPSDFSANLAHSDGDDMTATGDGGTWSAGTNSGLHVYLVDETPTITSAPILWKSFDTILRYWGVFVTGGTGPTYTAVYNYGSYPELVDENTLELAYRNNNCEFWKGTSATLDTGTNTLTRTGLYGTEFILGSYIDPRNAINYDGNNDYVGVSDNNTLDLGATGTLEAWINIAAHNANGGIIHKGVLSTTADEAYYLRLGPASNTIVLGLDNGSGTTTSITSASTLSTSTWYHIAGVWNSGTPVMNLYINGVLDQTGASATTPQNSSGGLNIGAQYTTAGSESPFQGAIDEVRVWNTERVQAQIRDNMCQKLIGSETGLKGYWRFDKESTNTSCPDYNFGTKNNGTMYNFGTAGAVITARICSPAPIGDDSAYGYGTSTAISSATLWHSDGDYLFATENTGTWNNPFSGIQMYRLDEAPVYPPDIATAPYAFASVGLTPPPGWSSIDYYRYWGVFVTDWTVTPTYQVVYNYSGNPSVPVDETVLGLAKRDQYCDRTWADAAATLNTTTNTLTKSGETTEYVLGGKDAPLAIALISFYAEFDQSSDCIRITWKTATEIETIGFQLWRSDTEDGPYTLISDSFMPSQAVSETTGAEYSYLDCNADLETYMTCYYKLEEIDLDNTRKNPVYGPIGPVTETVGASQFSRSTSKTQSSGGCFIDALYKY
ncbi:MAG: hypothetical protein HF978_16595 [Desulfobacteraceae bacterium]|nr:lamin tail domain-containing protein [Desulfobacteraceae bacterium]MBC2757163.1 hypothetical protein [Desulfobacteraceae bacterium]